MPPRPKKPSAKQSSKLLEVVKFLNTVAKDEGSPSETHILLSNKTATAFNGTIGAGCMIDEDLQAAPNARIFMNALMKCGENYQLTQIDQSKLQIKSGPFKANIPCIDPALLYFPNPDPNVAPITNEFKTALELVEKVKPENGQRVVTLSFLLNGPSIISTDGKILIEAWHGLNMPTNIPVPKAIIPVILNTKNLVGFGMGTTTVTFYFDDNSFIRSQLYAEGWPDVSPILNAKADLAPIPTDFFKALGAIESFSEKGLVYFQDDKLQSHDVNEKGAEFEVAGLKKGPVYSIKYLSMLKDVVEKVDFYAHAIGNRKQGSMLVFTGKNCRGVLMGFG